MDAWELADVEAARTAARPAVRGVPPRPRPVRGAVRPRGGRRRPAVAAHRGRALLRRQRPRPGDRRRRSPGTWRTGSLVFVAATRPAPLPRHRGATGDPRRLRSRRGRPRLIRPQPRTRPPEREASASSRASSGPRPTGSCRKKTYASIAGREERLQAGRPRGDLVGRVVVPAESQVQERRRSAGWSAAPGRRGARSRRARPRRRRGPRTSRRPARQGPGTRRRAAGRAATRRGRPPADRRCA